MGGKEGDHADRGKRKGEKRNVMHESARRETNERGKEKGSTALKGKHKNALHLRGETVLPVKKE